MSFVPCKIVEQESDYIKVENISLYPNKITRNVPINIKVEGYSYIDITEGQLDINAYICSNLVLRISFNLSEWITLPIESGQIVLQNNFTVPATVNDEILIKAFIRNKNNEPLCMISFYI